MQDLPVIFKWHNFQILEKALNFFMELKFCKSDVYFLNRHKNVWVTTYNFGSVYIVYLHVLQGNDKACVQILYIIYAFIVQR